KVELTEGSASWFTVSVIRPAAVSPEVCSFADLADGGAFSGSGGGYRSANLASNPGPIWSVTTVSASFGSVTTWNNCSLVMRFARNWSRPLDIFSRYTLWTDSRFVAPANNAEPARNSASRFIQSMITRRRMAGKRRRAARRV